MKIVKHFSVSLCLLFAASAVMAAQPFDNVVKHKYEEGQQVWQTLADEIRATPVEKIPELEARILATLAQPECTTDGKILCLRLLRDVAGPASAKAVGKYLTDEKYSDLARHAIEGAACAEATAELRRALGMSSGRMRIGIITSLGARRDAVAVPALSGLLTEKDDDTIDAVLQALGNIGTKDAAGILLKTRASGRLASKRDNSLLICAEHLIKAGDSPAAARIADSIMLSPSAVSRIGAISICAKADPAEAVRALSGFVGDADYAVASAAIAGLGQTGASSAASVIADRFGRLKPDLQLVALEALGMLRNKAAVPVVAKAMGATDKQVARAAVGVLGKVGSSAEIDPLLAALAKDGDLQGDVTTALANLQGEGLTGILLAKAKTADETVASVLVDSLIVRGDSAAVPYLLELLPTERSRIERAVAKAAARLGGAHDVKRMLDKMNSAPATVKSLESAVVSVIKRSEDAEVERVLLDAIETSRGDARTAAIRIAGQTGGEKSLQAMLALAKSSDAAVVDAAIRGICAYEGDANAAAIKLMGDVKQDSHRTLLARSVIARLDASKALPEEKVRVLSALAGRVTSVQDKQSILWALVKNACPDAVELANAMKNDPAVKSDAEQTARKIVTAMSKPTISASHNNEKIANAMDGDAGSRWDTSAQMVPGMWFMLQFSSATDVGCVTLDTRGSANDYPRTYDVQVSVDGKSWKTVVTDAKGSAVTKIAFDPAVKARQIKIVNKEANGSYYWSIHELTIE